jgi:hypothetical protein
MNLVFNPYSSVPHTYVCSLSILYPYNYLFNRPFKLPLVIPIYIVSGGFSRPGLVSRTLPLVP